MPSDTNFGAVNDASEQDCPVAALRALRRCESLLTRLYRELTNQAASALIRRKAKAAYQNFLTLWKDADPDIPILKQAKAEDAKLQ